MSSDSFRTYNFAKACLFAALHALLFALAFPPLDWWPLSFVAVAPLAWMALRTRRTSRALAAVMITQFLMWLWLNRWIIPVTGMGYPFLGLYMSLYPTIFVWLLRRIAKHRSLKRIPLTFVVPLLWTGLEFFRGQIAFDGYPWYLLAHPLIEWPLFAQSADLFGTYFISFLVAMPSGFIAGVAKNAREAVESPNEVDPACRAQLFF